MKSMQNISYTCCTWDALRKTCVGRVPTRKKVLEWAK